MWSSLLARHERSSTTHKLLLTQKFHEYRMDPADSVATHVAKVHNMARNMARQLLDFVETVTDLVIIAKILASLPSKYRSFRSAWNSVEPTRQTIEYLTQRLLEEESFFEAEDEEAGAFSATVRKGGKKSTKESQEKIGKKQDKRNVKCFCCNKKGHYARECHMKKKISSKNEQENTQNVALMVSNNKGKVFHLHEPSTEEIKKILTAGTADVWLTDSGASEHIICRRDWFSEYRPRKDGSTVSLGDDGECEVVGEGTILVKRLVNGEWRDGSIKNVLHVPALKKNLLSVGACVKKGLKVLFENETVNICARDKLCVVGIR